MKILIIKKVFLLFILIHCGYVFANNKKLSQQEFDVFRIAMKSSQAKVDQLKIAIPQLQKDINAYLNRAMDLERKRSEFLKNNPDVSRLSSSNREKLSDLNRERRKTYEMLAEMQNRLSGLKSELIHADGRVLAARVLVEPADLLVRDAVADGIRQAEGSLNQSRRDKEKADEVVISLNSHFDAEDMSLCLEQRLRAKLKDSIFYGRVSYNCSQQLAKGSKRLEAKHSPGAMRTDSSSETSASEKKPAVK